jgi:ribosomal protein S16
MRFCVKLVRKKGSADGFNVVVCPKKSNSIRKVFDRLGSVEVISNRRFVVINQRKLAKWVMHGAYLTPRVASLMKNWT